MRPEKYPAGPLLDQEGGARHRWVNKPDGPAWSSVLFSEWELTAASWTDEHVHDEFNYVIEGRLLVETGGVTIEAAAGDIVRIPAGATGRYWAPDYARMMSIYAPNPSGAKPTNMRYEELAS